LEEIGVDPGRLRIALVTQAFNGDETHPDCEEAAKGAAELCEELGHQVEETTLTVDAEALGEAIQVIVCANLKANLEERARVVGREFSSEDVEPVTYAMATEVGSMNAAQYAAAIRVIHATGRRVGRFFENFDVLLTPTMATPPLKLGELALAQTDETVFVENLRKTIGYTQLMNVAGNPAMSVPLFWNAKGLPVGVQFAGRFGDEATLFRLASQLEKAKPWTHRRPS
jgi:Asp-tRNA(Asn)/Glu-tRNA(Gln) amidotransferase A subunit family amidase